MPNLKVTYEDGLKVRPNRPLTRDEILTPAFVRNLLKVVDEGLVQGVGDPEPGEMCIEAAIGYAAGERQFGDAPQCVDPNLRNFKIVCNDDLGWEDNDDRALGLRRLGIAQLGTKGHFNAKAFAKSVWKLILSEYLPDFFAGLKPLRIEQEVETTTKTITTYHHGSKAKVEELTEPKGFNDGIFSATACDAAIKALCAGKLLTEPMKDALDTYAAEHDADYPRGSQDISTIIHIAKMMVKSKSATIEIPAFIGADYCPHEFCESIVQILRRMGTPGSKFLYLAPLGK